MAKNIIVCSDGTGNSAIKGRGTNVFKLYEAIDLNSHRHDPTLDPQIAFYDDGVGTERFKLLKIFAGATGWGLSRNVRQLYKEIVRIHDAGDRIFLFGFSRGAFTARTLAGFICDCGILDASRFKTADELDAAVLKAYRVYRRKYRTVLASWVLGSPSESHIIEFKKEYRSKPAKISFLGVWDTVDAVGLPFFLSDFINDTIYRFKFPDSELNRSIERACHALAIDDERQSFHPLIWKNDDRIEQVWFAGVHSNIGGGYPKQGMSLVTLDWMLAKAEAAGLRLVSSQRALYQELASVDDKLYNSRSGAGQLYRWKPRDIMALCDRCGIAPVVHLSVLERIAHGTNDYAPGNLSPRSTVVITPTGDPEKDMAARERAKRVEDVLRTAFERGKPLLAQVRGAVVAGRFSYYLFLATLLGTILAASTPENDGGIWEYFKNAGTLLGHLVTLRLGEVGHRLSGLLDHPGLLTLLLCGFGLSWLTAFSVDRRMREVFSEFWFDQQKRLRDALKHARRSAMALQATPEQATTADSGSAGPQPTKKPAPNPLLQGPLDGAKTVIAGPSAQV